MAWWLGSFPALPPSDDALFFLRGIERFSVLEFRPHFPGYPVFVALGKILNLWFGDAENALFWLCLGSVLLIPGAVALIIGLAGGKQAAQITGFLLALSQPLLPLVGIAMMSDGAGILFLLLSVIAWQRERLFLAGLILALALGVRPSYLVLVLAVLAGAAWFEENGRRRIIVGFCLGGLAEMLGILALEGVSYFWEAGRFLHGHFYLWGNTALAEAGPRGGWPDSLALLAGGEIIALFYLFLCLPVLLLILRQRNRQTLCLLAALGAGILWTVLFQNPESTRHLAPLAVLVSILLPLSAGVTAWGLIGLNMVILVPQMTRPPGPSPVHQAAAFLQSGEPAILIANRNIQLLRQLLPHHRVVGGYYTGSHAWLTSGGAGKPVWRLVVYPEKDLQDAGLGFTGRIPGEMQVILQSASPP